MNDALNVKALRTNRGWTQEQMAEYLGLNRSSVSRMETEAKNGKRRLRGPTEKLLRTLASDRASA